MAIIIISCVHNIKVLAMENIGVKELRDNLSNILKKVENGEVIRIMRHGKAVAEINPLLSDKDQLFINHLKKSDMVGGGSGSIGLLRSVKNLSPDKPVSDIVVEDRR